MNGQPQNEHINKAILPIMDREEMNQNGSIHFLLAVLWWLSIDLFWSICSILLRSRQVKFPLNSSSWQGSLIPSKELYSY